MQTDTAWHGVFLTCVCCVFIVILACVFLTGIWLQTDDVPFCSLQSFVFCYLFSIQFVITHFMIATLYVLAILLSEQIVIEKSYGG